MWNWVVECLAKGGEPGPYTYIVSQIKKYDVLGLYCAVLVVANVQTPFAYQKKMEEFINATPQKGETFFTFATRLEQLASSIEVPQQLAPKCPVTERVAVCAEADFVDQEVQRNVQDVRGPFECASDERVGQHDLGRHSESDASSAGQHLSNARWC